MSLFQNASEIATKIVSTFRGSQPRLDSYSVPDGNALFSANTSYIKGQCASRYGHSATFSDSSHGNITSLYDWNFTLPNGLLSNQWSIITYYAPSYGVLGWTQYPTLGFLGSPLFPTTGAGGAIMVGTGLRLYAAFYDATGKTGAASAQVYGADCGAHDNLFAAPIQNTVSASETASGVVTAGVHRIGYVFTTRNGYTGKLCPVDNGGNFTPLSFTSTGNHNLQVTISGSLPSYLNQPATPGGSVFQIVMTVVGQPDTYYAVPGAYVTCGNPTVITININDYDLAATGTDFTNYQLLLSSSVNGTPPFYPNCIFTYSSRMGYVTVDSAGFPVTYFSEPNAFQYITADQHGIYLEGNAAAIVGFSLRGVAYLGTAGAFYSCEDSGDVPVNWTPPQKVDGSIGVLSPTCVTVNPSLGYAAIAADRGFYIFQGGIFPALPLSYYQQPDWGRINWANPTQIKVVDDQLNKRFIVLAPLTSKITAVTGTANNWILTTDQNPTLYPNMQASIDGVSAYIDATLSNNAPSNKVMWTGTAAPAVGMTIYPAYASHQMTWDYTDGDTPETIKYSLNSMANYAPSAMATVVNLPNAIQEVWYAPSNVQSGSGGNFLRQCDGTENSNSYTDIDAVGNPWPVMWIYTVNLIPGYDDTSTTFHFYYGMHMRAFGAGDMTFSVQGLDGNPTIIPAQSGLTLSRTPGSPYLITWFLMSAQQSVTFALDPLGAANSNCVLSMAEFYYSEQMAQQ